MDEDEMFAEAAREMQQAAAARGCRVVLDKDPSVHWVELYKGEKKVATLYWQEVNGDYGWDDRMALATPPDDVLNGVLDS